MAAFIDAAGQTQQIQLDVTMYRQAADAGMSLQQYLNTNFPTNAEKYGNTWNQILASEGIVVSPNKEFGMRSSTLAEVFDGVKMEAGVVTRDANPVSRILFPAITMEAVENKLVENLTMTANAFDNMIAFDETINGDRYEYPVLDFSNPEAARSQGIAQLAMPTSMMLVTASDVSRKIPGFSLGCEISDQALKVTSLDFLAMSLARQAAVERNGRAQGYMLALLNGDIDTGDASLSSLGLSANADTYDSTITADGVLTQKAWAKYLIHNATKRTINTVVCDVDTALAIEGRTGRPTVQTDNPNSPRIDTTFAVMNQLWPTSVNLFLTVDANWPANTIMGFDKKWAIKRVRSLSASYQSIEAFVTRRSTVMRFDFGESVSRFQNEAFDVLTLVNT